MKYIDAEKLKAEIERRMDAYDVSIEKYATKQKSLKSERDAWKWAECKSILAFIDSLQQELPEMDGEVIVLIDELGTAPIYKIAFGHIEEQTTYKIKIGSEIKEFTPIYYNGWNIPGVKYWMPCPEIPNNVKTKRR